MIVSKIKEDDEVLKVQNKALDENNKKLIYAKGWNRKGEPIKKDDLIKHLNEKNKKASSEKKDYIDKHDSLL